MVFPYHFRKYAGYHYRVIGDFDCPPEAQLVPQDLPKKPALKARNTGPSRGFRQSREPSLTVGLLNRCETQVSSPRVSKGSASTQRLTRL